MRFAFLTSTAVALALAAGPAEATVSVAIDLTHQRMHVEGAEGSYDWPISSARSGFSTPPGFYAPTHLELMHYSKKYHMSPMPHAIFFRGGYAIHGTYSVGELGRPASHGCVRLSPGHAATLYAMVQHEGARISISGHPPASLPFASEYASRRRGGERFATSRTYDGYPGSDEPYGAYPQTGAYPYGYGYSYAPSYAYAPQGARPPSPYGGYDQE